MTPLCARRGFFTGIIDDRFSLGKRLEPTYLLSIFTSSLLGVGLSLSVANEHLTDSTAEMLRSLQNCGMLFILTRKIKG